MLDHIAAGIGGGGGGGGGGLAAGARVALMVNSLGATAGMELAVAARAALARLAALRARLLPRCTHARTSPERLAAAQTRSGLPPSPPRLPYPHL